MTTGRLPAAPILQLSREMESVTPDPAPEVCVAAKPVVASEPRRHPDGMERIEFRVTVQQYGTGRHRGLLPEGLR